MTVKVGEKAPVLTLKRKTSEGLSEVTIPSGARKTVLLFFPLAFTSVCTEELCSVSAGLEQYAGLNADVFGISVDSPFAQEAFAKASHITVPLLSDFNKEAASAYGVLFPDLVGLKGVAKRSAFVIGADGKVLHAESSDDPAKLPDFAKIRAALGGK
jgi:peroxiredoxin